MSTQTLKTCSADFPVCRIAGILTGMCWDIPIHTNFPRPADWKVCATWTWLAFFSLLYLLVPWSLEGQTTNPPALSRFEFSQPHMGSLWRITLYAPDAHAAETAVKAAFARVAALDAMMTDYNAESELCQLFKKPYNEPVPISAELLDVLERSQELARQTDGAFDVTVGPYVQLWRRARRQHELPSPERMTEARATVGYQKLKLDHTGKTATLLVPNMRLDVGGIAKGYGADAALRVLRGRGFPRAFVAASGDLSIGDPPPGRKGWHVSIGSAENKTNTLDFSLELHNVGVSTSGDVEQFVELGGVRYSHIVDSATGLGLTNRIQATIIADNATLSDAMATAVCVMGVENGLKMVNADRRLAALVITGTDGKRTLHKSKRMLDLLP